MATEYILDKDELEKRLVELAETPFTGELSYGAMCYLMTGPDDDEYKCVICNKLTFHMRFSDTYEIIKSIREIVDEMREAGYDVWLDEREYCDYCSVSKELKKDVWLKEGLVFNIRFSAEQQYHQVQTIRISDFLCLHAFLLGKDYFEGERNQSYSIHDNIDLIHKMTGLGESLLEKWIHEREVECDEYWKILKDDTPRNMDYYRLLRGKNNNEDGNDNE